MKPHAWAPFLAAAMAVVCLSAASVSVTFAADTAKRVDFNRDVLPILSDNCFACHGPDANKRKAKLRLDTKDGIFAERDDGDQIVVPGKSAASELYARITSTDDSQRMPERKANRQLTPAQVDLLKRWIDEGASYTPHWAYVAPQRPQVPQVKKEKGWPRNPIDNFVLARLAEEGLKPSPAADRATLLRRVSFDLTGLPPTPAEVKVFIEDKSSNAYEKQVDRLLDSPRYGENMARTWLDLARYADSHGGDGGSDSLRGMWPWRDWVINAYNRNLPFDQFTIKQLAGDLLPNATLEDKIATGFDRNNTMDDVNLNDVSKPVDWERRVNYVADRVSTTGAVWLGLTVGCARCHDHKYDPVKQKDFYRLAAYFNSVPETNSVDRNGNAEPLVALPSQQQTNQIADLQSQIVATLKKLPEAEMVAQENQWSRDALAAIAPSPTAGLIAHYEFENTVADSSGQHHDAQLKRDPVQYVPGAVGKAAFFNATAELSFGNVADFDRATPFAVSMWAAPDRPETEAFLQKRDSSPNWSGFEIALEDGDGMRRVLKVVIRLASHWPDNAIEIRSKERVFPTTRLLIKEVGARGQHLLVNYDGSGKASGLKLYLNGNLVETEITKDQLTGSIRTSAPLSVDNGDLGQPFRGLIDDLRIYDRVLSRDEIDNLHTEVPARELLTALKDKPVVEIEALHETVAPEKLDIVGDDPSLPPEVLDAVLQKRRQAQLSDYFLSRGASQPVREAYAQLTQLRAQKLEVEKSIPTTMVMAEMEKPNDTFLLGRGQFYNKIEKVTPGVPSFLLELPKDAPPNRLALAHWLVDPKNPLTARVEVNRYWQNFFGTGIVKTAEDFGSQGERPTHPELLDWLATEFIRTGWDIKAMQRLIVLSATYRQSSDMTAHGREVDPENRLLARGPRVRLAAEQIRDNALAVSGLLNEKTGGQSVYPYQPAGIWTEGGANFIYTEATGDDLYRRSLYTVWRRTTPAPSMSALDAPDRAVCVARRNLTNTPLQALVLMDDPTYVEVSRMLAQRAIQEGGANPSRRLGFLFTRAVERKPTSRERALLLPEARDVLARFRQDPEAARKLLSVGSTKPDPNIGPEELATWTVVARTILNMDEAITKQ